MLFKDLIKVYKVFYVHVSEILERFAQFDNDESKQAMDIY
jgi:hypothetical protein